MNSLVPFPPLCSAVHVDIQIDSSKLIQTAICFKKNEFSANPAILQQNQVTAMSALPSSPKGQKYILHQKEKTDFVVRSCSEPPNASVSQKHKFESFSKVLRRPDTYTQNVAFSCNSPVLERSVINFERILDTKTWGSFPNFPKVKVFKGLTNPTR